MADRRGDATARAFSRFRRQDAVCATPSPLHTRVRCGRASARRSGAPRTGCCREARPPQNRMAGRSPIGLREDAKGEQPCGIRALVPSHASSVRREIGVAPSQLPEVSTDSGPGRARCVNGLPLVEECSLLREPRRNHQAPAAAVARLARGVSGAVNYLFSTPRGHGRSSRPISGTRSPLRPLRHAISRRPCTWSRAPRSRPVLSQRAAERRIECPGRRAFALRLLAA